MGIDDLVKDKGWYRGLKKDWEFEAYGFYPRGLGDLIYNNLRRIIEDKDTSKWAENVFNKALVLLIQGKRWPDELDPEKVKGKKRYRSQKSMTRDPWVMFYAACIHFNKREFISLKPQWRLYRPELWALRKALLGEKNSYLFWRSINSIFPKKDYVEVLDEYMKWCYDNREV